MKFSTLTRSTTLVGGIPKWYPRSAAADIRCFISVFESALAVVWTVAHSEGPAGFRGNGERIIAIRHCGRNARYA